MRKAELRKFYLDKRASVSSQGLVKLSRQIAARVIPLIDSSETRFLHHYIALTDKHEVENSFIVDQVVSASHSLATVVPRVSPDNNELEHIRVTGETEFLKSDWGIPEPVGDDTVDEKLIDVVLVPLLCFDRRGHRVGYGGGYYDKFLAKCRPDCLKIGLSLFGPVDEIEDIHDGDVRLDYCVTPEKVYCFIDH